MKDAGTEPGPGLERCPHWGPLSTVPDHVVGLWQKEDTALWAAGRGDVSSRPSRERTARLQTRHYPRILDAAWALDIPGPLSSDETPPSCVLATPGPSPVPWQSSALPGIRWFFSHSQRRDLLLPLSPHRSAVPLTCSPRRSQIQRQSGRWGPGPGAGG